MTALHESIAKILTGLPLEQQARFIAASYADMLEDDEAPGGTVVTARPEDLYPEDLYEVLRRWEEAGERENALHALARGIMALRPELKPLSLDEWISQYGRTADCSMLTEDEEEAGEAILKLFSEDHDQLGADSTPPAAMVTLRLSGAAAAVLKSMAEFAEDAVRGDGETDVAIINEIMAELRQRVKS